MAVEKKKSQRSASANAPSEVRVAYPYFHEKRTKSSAGTPFTYPAGHAKAGQPNPRYAGTFMFPKLHTDAFQCPNYMWLWGLAVEAAHKMWPQSVDAQGQWAWPQGAQYAVKDGDVPFVPKPKPGVTPPTAEEIARKNTWRKGYWIVESENFLDPGPRIATVVNGQMLELPTKVINGQVMYKSGDYGIPNFHAWAYENETFGVNFGFDGFCFTREGEAIGSSGPKSAAQMFAGLGVMPAPGGAAMPPLPGGAPSVAPPAAPPAAPVAPPVAPVAPPVAAPIPPAPPAPPAGAPPLPPEMPGAAPNIPAAVHHMPPPPPAGAPALPPIPGR